MSKTCIIYVVRHGQSVFNEQALISGHVDPPLSDKGREQAHDTKDELAHTHFDAIYSSDLQRAIETGEIIYGKPIPDDNQIHELRERHFGQLEGQSDDLLTEGNKRKATLPHEERWAFKHVPGMESDHEVSLRFADALEKIAKENYGQTILVAAHGSAIRTMLMRIQGLTENELPPGSFANAGYAKLSYNPDGFKVLKTVGVRYNYK